MWRSDESGHVTRTVALARAVGDETRVRILLALLPGELCLCQIVDLFSLAPSTVSKHLKVLADAGLVRRRKEGRWHYFRLAATDAPAPVRQAIDWVRDCAGADPTVRADADRAREVVDKDLEELSRCCYRS